MRPSMPGLVLDDVACALPICDVVSFTFLPSPSSPSPSPLLPFSCFPYPSTLVPIPHRLPICLPSIHPYLPRS